jgi:uncharacterized LabA/DUF88 family protein
MTKKIIDPEISTDMADSEFSSYEYNVYEDKIKIKIDLWNAKECVFEFYDHILFVDRIANNITALCIETEETDLYKQAIKKMCNFKESTEKYKHFQFLDLYDEPCIEIICTHFSSKVMEK